MQPTTKILARIAQNSRKNKDEVFTKLFRYLLRPDLYFEAYKHLYANNGAATKGSSDDTADGFSERKIAKITKILRSGTFQPTPVIRTYIVKKNNRLPAKSRKSIPLSFSTSYFLPYLIFDFAGSLMQVKSVHWAYLPLPTNLYKKFCV